MSLISDALFSGFQALETVLGDACTISGISCTAVFSAVQSDSVFADYSNRENVSLTAVVTKTLITSKPSDRSAVVKGADTYYIHRVDESPTHFTLYLREFNDGAVTAPSGFSSGFSAGFGY